MNLQELLSQVDPLDAFGAHERVRDSEKLQHVLIGSPEKIQRVIQTLYALHYAEVTLWSPIVPMPGSNLSMSILTRYQR